MASPLGIEPNAPNFAGSGRQSIRREMRAQDHREGTLEPTDTFSVLAQRRPWKDGVLRRNRTFILGFVDRYSIR